MVARLSSRVFLGPEMSNNEDWLSITKEYTVHSVIAAFHLRMFPLRLRALAHWFLPECKMVRKQVAQSREIISPVIRKRREAREQAAAEGRPVPDFNDALDWFEEESRGKAYDPVLCQLGLSFVAIHTTTDLLTEAMLRIAENPDLFGALRTEIVGVLKTEGWKKTALFNMKLLDSVLKESQRLRPVSMGK